MLVRPKSRTYWLVLIAIAYVGLMAQNEFRFGDKNILKNEFDYFDVNIQSGNQEEWADIDCDDSSWDATLPYSSWNPQWWFRARMEIKKSLPPNRVFGIKVSTTGGHAVYWDGILLGKNGLEGRDLRSAKYHEYYLLPESKQSPGIHQIALQIVSEDMSQIQYPRILVDDYLNLSREPLILSLFIHLLGGIYLMLLVYFLVQYGTNSSEKSLLVFGLLCFLFFGLLMLEYIKFYYQYSIHFQLLRLEILQILTLSAAFLLPLFVLLRVKIRTKSILASACLLIALYGMVFLFQEGYDKRAHTLMSLSLTLSTGFSFWAVYREIKHSVHLLIAFVCASLGLLMYYDLMLFVGFGLLGIIVCAGHILKTAREKQEHTKSLLKAKRLEIELLKKKLQPHFLMNTLTSLIDILEEDPSQARKFIHALAQLFDIVNNISSKTHIPIRQEIDLCRTHLEVMGYRKDIRYRLHTKNIQHRETIPPAILLTVIENGISHNKPIKDEMNFEIEYEETDAIKAYRVFASGKVRKGRNKAEEGIGHQYVKARLNECYSEREWQFHSRETSFGWLTEITISK